GGELVHVERNPLQGILLIEQSDLDVVRERFLESIRQRARPHRAIEDERFAATSVRRREPSRQPDVGESDRVIRMKVSQEMRGHAPQRNTGLPQSDGDASPQIEEQLLLTGFDQRALTITVGAWSGCTGAQQGD